MSTFYYSTLQYRHSIALGEQLNVAVLVLFPEVPEVRFLFPDQLRRLSLAYPGTPEGIVKKYLASMAKRVVTLNRNPELFASYDLVHQPEVFLASEFLQADDSALQFGPFRSGVLYDTPEKVAQSLYHLLLSHYTLEQEQTRRHNEQYLSQKFRKIVKAKAPSLFEQNLIEENKLIRRNEQEYSFDFAWRNGAYKLVKSISFDVKKAETIQIKSERYFGQFTILADEADKENWRFDLLLARPSDKRLFKPYDKAVDILSRSPHVKLVEEKGIDNYVDSAIGELLHY